MKKLLLYDSTRKLWLLCTMMIFVFLAVNNSNAQCNNSTPYGTAALTTATGSTGTVFCNWGGEYGTWNGIAAFYSYTTTSTVATDFITVRSGSPGGPVVASGTQPLSWIATTTAVHYIHVNTNSSYGTANACRNIVTTNNGSVAPATPPTPTQSAGIPTCTGGTDLTVVGTPAANVQWYWQSTPSGTSTSNPYVGAYTVFANGTYYLNSYNSLYALWAASPSSITVSNFTTATPPPAPVAALDPSCAPVEQPFLWLQLLQDIHTIGKE